MIYEDIYGILFIFFIAVLVETTIELWGIVDDRPILTWLESKGL